MEKQQGGEKKKEEKKKKGENPHPHKHTQTTPRLPTIWAMRANTAWQTTKMMRTRAIDED